MKKWIYQLTLVCSVTLFSGVINTADAQTRQKSKKAKYTAIGAGVGAGTGIATSRNDSKGAAIGGVIGAGAGYMYGRHKDKKNGRRKN